MSYDEKADLDLHATDVYGLGAIAQGMGAKIEGYELALDIGGGLGLHAPFLQSMANRIYVSDIIDYTLVYESRLLPLMIEKYKRNNVSYDCAKTEYHKVDAQKLIYKDRMFDLVFSVNAFEHIPNPTSAFHEMVRVTRPGGLVMVQFDPLWHSAFGHHLWGLNFEPWTHLILSPEAMYEEIGRRGGAEHEIHIYDHDTNRCSFGLFKSLFAEEAKQYFSRFHFDYWSKSAKDDPNGNHPNYKKARQLGFGQDDLLVRGVQFVGIRS
jgi:ubiquinone/menaquinone biosynthesis C-methylase UbiE